MQPADPPFAVGSSVLHYQIIGELGAGGMGVVYRAYDTKLKRTVALKFLPPEQKPNGVQRDRFLREATAASALDHPNIGTVHAVEETPDGVMFIVMTYYEGTDLKHRIKQGRLEVFKALDIATQMARGLAAAHAAGIVHRDLKPSNTIITTQGVVKIIDFGLAKVVGDSDLTEQGTRLGTIGYMSPEQAMGERADHRSDLWSLGVLLYEMLTGRLPFTGENGQAVLYRIVNDAVPPMEGVAPSLQAIVQRALEKRPEERYQSAAEIIRDIETIHSRSQQSTVLLPDVSGRSEKPRPRILPWVFAGTVLLAALLGFIAWRSGWTGVSRPGNFVAVLPFQGAAADPAQQALATGWADAISDSLSRLEASNRDFLVVPVGDLRLQRVKEVTDARRLYAVSKVLKGDLTQQGGRIRLALTLVDAARQQPAGSISLEDSEDHLSAMYARSIAEAARLLGLQTPAGSGPQPATPAYANWLRGVGFLERYDQAGYIDSAVREFEAALRESQDPLVWVGLSQAYRLRYEVTKDPQWIQPARDSVAKAIALDKNIAAEYISRGAIRNLERDYKGAVEDFERALLLDARIDEAFRGLARAFEGIGLKDRAESTLRNAIAARPGYWNGYNRLGAFYSRQGKYREAATQFRTVILLTPDNASGYSNLGSTLSRLGDLVEARRMLETAVRLAPTLAVYNNLGNLLVRQKSYAEAAQVYEKALELDRNNYLIWANLAASYRRTSGQQARAADAYQQAIARAEKARTANPNDVTILSDLASYYAYLGKRSEPLELLNTALAMAPSDTGVLVNAAETYEILGFREQAIEWLGKALQLGFPLKDIQQTSAFEELLKDSRFKHFISDSR